MANPQAEDGHIDIANEIAEALMRTNLSAYQGRILWAIWRKTYGWHKKEDLIPLNQLVAMTGIAQPHVSRTLKELKLRRILTQSGMKLSFNKDYTQWKTIPHRVYTPLGYTPLGYKHTPSGIKNIPRQGDSKETTKETIQKKEYISLAKKILEGYPRIVSEARTLRNIITTLKKKVEPEDLIRARDNYREEVEKDNIETQFIFKSTNFFGEHAEWRNYVNPEIDEDAKALRDFRKLQEEIGAKKESAKAGKGEGSRPD